MGGDDASHPRDRALGPAPAHLACGRYADPHPIPQDRQRAPQAEANGIPCLGARRRHQPGLLRRHRPFRRDAPHRQQHRGHGSHGQAGHPFRPPSRRPTRRCTALPRPSSSCPPNPCGRRFARQASPSRPCCRSGKLGGGQLILLKQTFASNRASSESDPVQTSDESSLPNSDFANPVVCATKPQAFRSA
jgi:hypothetical protein